jgi:hypothetical protein
MNLQEQLNRIQEMTGVDNCNYELLNPKLPVESKIILITGCMEPIIS